MRIGGLLLFILFFSEASRGYPNFIGLGYNTCTVCHFNTQGNGPLSDYGRALFAQEIAARPFLPQRITDDTLAENSGFIPGKELPYWIRPAVKLRGLWVRQDPNLKTSVDRWIEMQKDINLVFSLDPGYRTILALSYNQLPKPSDYYHNGKDVVAISREHYLRFYPFKNLSLALGLMDKVYGIRTADHTAAGRQPLGFGQNDQAHGALFEFSQPSWTFDLHLFQGNLLQPLSYRQKGTSLMLEMDLYPKNRGGFSYASFSVGENKYERLAIHDRWGLPNTPDSALLAEVGFKKDTVFVTNLSKTGSYASIESTVKIIRGYYFLTAIDRTQDELTPVSPDRQRWTIGLLTFPFQRFEVRTTFIHYKGFSTEEATKDQQALQGQIHASF